MFTCLHIVSFQYRVLSYYSLLTVPGNLLSSTILMSPNLDMKTSFRHILLMLTLYDTSFCLLAATTFSMPLVRTTS